MLSCISHSILAWLQIIKLDVDQQKKKISYLPYCRLTIMWKGEPTNTFPLVSRRVDLEGTINPSDYFIIKLPGRGKIVDGERFQFSLAAFTKAIAISRVHACTVQE